MSDPLGLSIGTTNMVAARVGNPPVTRPSVLTVSGRELGGFVERVGDPVPLVAADGTAHRADDLLVALLEELVEGAEETAEQIAIAVPAHWNGATLRSLRNAVRASTGLGGTSTRLVSDAVTALTALHAGPGLPTHGVTVLVDLGGGGTTITLADAAAAFEPIETRRVPDFAGAQIDQALVTHVLDHVGAAGGVDPAGTVAVGSLTLLRDECRRAKETLSTHDSADVTVELPGHRSVVTVTREHLDPLLAVPLDAVLSELDDLLRRNHVAADDVSSIAAVGGGAGIPLVARRLAEHGSAPVLVSAAPALDAALGAAVFAAHAADSDAATGMAQVPAITEVISDAEPGSATFRALAWSQDEAGDDGVLPFAGEYGGSPYGGSYDVSSFDDAYDASTTRAVAEYVPPAEPVARGGAWQRLPLVVFGVSAAVALVAVGGVAIALTSSSEDTRPTSPPAAPAPVTSTLPSTQPAAPPPTTAPPPQPATQAPPQTVTVTSEAPPPTVTVERPAPVTTTTTTVAPTTTPTTTPTTPTTTPTTTPPAETTTTTTTPEGPVMTTSYLTVPFVPVPIPIQVPSTSSAPPVYQQPPYYQQPPVYQQPPYYQQPPVYQQPPQFPY